MSTYKKWTFKSSIVLCEEWPLCSIIVEVDLGDNFSDCSDNITSSPWFSILEEAGRAFCHTSIFGRLEEEVCLASLATSEPVRNTW
jgi:hypothetical protein